MRSHVRSGLLEFARPARHIFAMSKRRALFLALMMAAFAAALPSAAGAAPLQLAQFQDPSMPIRPNEEQRQPRREDSERSPFALPTTALPRSSPSPGDGEDDETPAIPGAADYPPYEKEMARLAEILGSMHYLGGLCNGNDTRWRGQMETLLEAESPAPAWRARLVGSFNSGYRSFERTYRACTPAAERAVEIYLAEGEQLAGTIKARYAN